jgi:type II secretory pathway predicted ATPase ExeA
MNYDSFFGFSESPFLDVPDLKFLFLTRKHEAALAELTEFVTARQGIAVVSGDDGAGKTMLMQALIQRLPQSFHPLILTKPAAEPLAIILTLAQSLGLDVGEKSLVNLTPLADAIRAAAQQQQYLLLIMEDAHLLTDQNLEEIYVLSQLENHGQHLMPIILVGRKGLIPKVSSKANQRLHDLIRKNIFLGNLTFEETTLYIDHRLQQVGSSFKERFAEGCHGQIFSRTGGIPRRINEVCDQALTRAWQEKRSRVTRDLLGGEESPTPYKPLEPPSKWRFLNTVASLVTGVAIVGLAIFILYNNYVSVPPASPPPPATPAPAVPEKAPEKVPEKTPVAPLEQEPNPAPATVPQPQPPTQTAEQATPNPEPGPPTPPSPPAPAEAGPSPAAVVPPVPQAGNPPAEPESSQPTTYKVAAQDGLLKIVSTYYPNNKDIGYDAVILANHNINNEDFIYPGQTLTLPKVNNSNNIITLDGNEYFKTYGLYYSSADVARATAKLKEQELHFVVRETEIPGEGKIYRVFLGSYSSPEELKKAMAELGSN